MTEQTKNQTITGILIGSIGLLAAAGCAEPASAEAPAPIVSTRSVLVARAAHGPIVHHHRFSGVVRGSHRAQLVFTLSGRLESRPAQIGDVAAKGAVLATIDRRPLRNNLAAAIAGRETLRSRLGQLGRDTERAARLLAAEAIGREELEKTQSARDTLRSQLTAADVEVAEAKRLLAEAVLRAPFAGTVVDVQIEPGEFAQAGQPAVLLSGESEAEVELEVPDRLRATLTVGDQAEVRFPLSDTAATTGRVTKVGRASGGAGQLVPVVVVLAKDSDAVAGQTVEIILRSEQRAGLTIPAGAVVDPSGSRPSAFRVSDGIATITPIELGELVADRVVVRAGLEPGDRVIVSGHANLVSGEAVAVANELSAGDASHE